MINEIGILLERPKVYVAWGAKRDKLIEELSPWGLKYNRPGTDVMYFDKALLAHNLSGSFSLSHFTPIDKCLYGAWFHPIYESGTDLKQAFTEVQSILIKLLGNPFESYPEYGIDNKRLDGYRWFLGDLEICHAISERHGPDHHVSMLKKYKNRT